MIGAGGGGDVVGALAVTRLCAVFDTPAVLGGVAWERLPVDPHPGPRPVEQVHGGRRLGDRVVLADGDTATPEGVPFSESLMARHLGEETVLVDITAGAEGVAVAIADAARDRGCDLAVLADVGGDILARGEEAGLASPLCDAVMLGGALHLAEHGGSPRCLLAVVGAGCDGELTPAEVLGRIASAARADAWMGAWAVSLDDADAIEAAARNSPTEASLQVARCARGELGAAPIRGGRRSVELSPVGAMTFYLDPLVAPAEVTPLADAVRWTRSLEEAQEALAARGLRTELDYEREHAGT